MDHAAGGARPHSRRQPLTDATSRANNSAAGPTRGREGVAYYHEQLKVADPLSSHINPSSAENKPPSAVTESLEDLHRNSAISTASTTSTKGRRKTHVGPWQLGRTLGKGATGRVRLAKHAVTGQAAAIKIVSKKSAAMVQSESIAAMDRNAGFLGAPPGSRPMPFGIEREVVIMKLIEHPNVINLYDVWENRGELYLVLEYVEGGELFDYVSTHGPLPEEEAVRLFRQIISGLAYCHRFNICHRDLKPENILLDANHNIKLADFGMAALQPAGHWLNTSCGSPHYAAPEIIYGRRYRGDKADIWSCGIILYALLTGFLPFDGGDLSTTLRLVKKGEYHLPAWLSVEAADLIQRILQKRPEDRISIQNMWNHPLLKKYEALHQAMSDHPLGPPPPLSAKDCGPPVASRADIDMELLRNLQTLWHCAKPETLIEKLLSEEPNLEKMFYNALIKFRDEQLENYDGQPLEYSASDYHHISRPPAAVRAVARYSRNGRVQTQSRRRSQFSILTDVSRRSSSAKEPKSSQSYDPFRASLSPVANPSVEYANVTIHRKSSDVLPATESSEGAETSKQSTVRKVQQPEEANCVPNSSVELIQWNRKKKAERSCHSRSSLAHSRRGFSPAPGVRAASSYKRNVSFRHIRNRSQTGSIKSKRERTRSQNSIAKDLANDQISSIMVSGVRYSSPALPSPPAVVRTSDVVAGIGKDLDIKKVRDCSSYWKEEARKVSAELSQICEEAFNRSSVSTGRTVESSIAGASDSTATSMSIYEEVEQSKSSAKPGDREVPEPPAGISTSCTVRELAETRRKLIEHSAKAGSEGLPDYLKEVIAHLDRLIEQDTVRQQRWKSDETDQSRRAISEPIPKRSADTHYLPAISEELASPMESPTASEFKHPDHQQARPGSARPVSARPNEKATIRMVPRDSSLPSINEIKPLTIRKRSTGTSGTTGVRSSSAESGGPSKNPSNPVEERQGSTLVGCMRYNSRYHMALEPIEENPPCPRRSDARGSAEKKWSWFSKHKSQVYEETPPTPKDVPAGSNSAVPGNDVKAEVSQVPVDETKTTAGKTSGEKSKSAFLKIFGKKRTERGDPEGHKDKGM
ncbi:hypothetical protein VTN77DRAFT_5504 [Rasamsonia byssochlamydoides]|uniref:uncharacterized protein n=1 Tax=Rasamsonia byssochlamydoides TaxID=89139 RepID=UPI003743C778